jgi:hypothetical protein
MGIDGEGRSAAAGRKKGRLVVAWCSEKTLEREMGLDYVGHPNRQATRPVIRCK